MPEIVTWPYDPDRGPEDYPEGHPMRNPWHHARCATCDHRRDAHYDEGGVCLHGFTTEPGCRCEAFAEPETD